MAAAPLAIFFSLATTFSFPGMMMYSVEKSPSMSTPSLLLGRSLMWPSEASTSKSLPRYLLMLRALAGDSTMTRDLVNVLFSGLVFVKLTRSLLPRQLSRQKYLVLSIWYLAISTLSCACRSRVDLLLDAA